MAWLFKEITERVPWPLALAVVLAGGYPVFLNVVRATLKGQIISHTLMTLGVIAALVVGEWVTAAVVVLFMRVGDYAERFTTERARGAVKDLTQAAPQTARVERDGVEAEIPVQQVNAGDVVIVRPGEKIPVDGEVVKGQAVVDQATITGESMPVEAGPGSRVYAATFLQSGSLRVKTISTGPDTTFGKIIRLVEEAEAHRANIQRVADKFSSYYLPIVAGIAILTFLLRRDPLSTAAVLVVACSCSFALATPIAMLASIGAGARRGVLIKGGKVLEILARADVVLVDKTGTLTLGKPHITDMEIADGGLPIMDFLTLTASAERYSEHPLAEAVRQAAQERGVKLLEPESVEYITGMGVKARVGEHQIMVGNRRLFAEALPEALPQSLADRSLMIRADELERNGKTVLFVVLDGELAGILAAADRLRPEVPQALADLHLLGIRQIELLTGDNEKTAAMLFKGENGRTSLQNIPYRANLLPEDKISIVKDYQARGHTVIMVGDGINDAPALAQADVGIAIGTAGSDIAIEAAHIALMRQDWSLVPEVLRIARRTMNVIRLNIGFTAVYNVLGLSLAAFGILPPVLAAAAQSLPDLGIVANSSRLLRQR